MSDLTKKEGREARPEQKPEEKNVEITSTTAAPGPSFPSQPASANIGQADREPPGHPVKNVEEEGMLIGPEHPIFHPRQPHHPHPGPSVLPSGAVPPGARFDPISPLAPNFSSGEPDFDDLPPPGGPNYGPRPARPARRGRGNEGEQEEDEHSSWNPLNPPQPPSGTGNPPFFM